MFLKLQVKYKEDHKNMIGKATPIIEDMTIRRVKQATINASDIAYKGLKNKTSQMEAKRAFAVNHQGSRLD